MTEFWVSQKQYFCKYCEIFIRDDAPSRRQHESGLRHQGNKERYVRNIYKQGEKKKKDEDEERREMARIEQAANAAYAADVGSGRAGPSTGPSSSASPGPSSAPKPARSVAAPSTGILSSHVKPSAQNKAPSKPVARNYDNYTTAAELGIIDPDVQRKMEEAERRREEAFVGEWTVVESTPSRGISATPVEAEDGVKVEDGAEVKAEEGGEVGQKRPAPPIDDEDDAGHRWKLRKKTAAVGLGELYDPGVIKLKPRVKAQPVDATTPATMIGGEAAGWTGATAETRSNATEAPKWTPLKWKKPGEALESSAPLSEQAASVSPPVEQETNAEMSPSTAGDSVGAEDPAVKPVKQEEVDVKPILEAPVAEAPSGLFKKRKRPIRS